MIRSELVAVIASRFYLARPRAESVVGQILDIMAATMVAGGRIEIRGFGVLTVRHHGEHGGHHPRTREVIIVRPKRLPHFKPGTDLRERMEAERSQPSPVAR
jgi:integration host factor subunit beta